MKGFLIAIAIAIAVVCVAGWLAVRFNYVNLSANPKCQHDCYENGKRVR